MVCEGDRRGVSHTPCNDDELQSFVGILSVKPISLYTWGVCDTPLRDIWMIPWIWFGITTNSCNSILFLISIVFFQWLCAIFHIDSLSLSHFQYAQIRMPCYGNKWLWNTILIVHNHILSNVYCGVDVWQGYRSYVGFLIRKPYPCLCDFLCIIFL